MASGDVLELREGPTGLLTMWNKGRQVSIPGAGPYIVQPILDANNNVTGLVGPSGGGITAMGALDVRGFGAKADGQYVQDAVIANRIGSGPYTYTVTSSTAIFTSADVGKSCASVAFASGQQFGFNSTIVGFTNSKNITISCSNASAAASPALFVWGTDDTVAVTAVIAAAAAARPMKMVYFPTAITTIATSTTITVPAGVSFVGDGKVSSVDYSYIIPFSGSTICLTSFIASGAMFQMGSTSSDHSGSNIRDVTVDTMALAGISVQQNGRACEANNTTFLRGTNVNLNGGSSSVISGCTFAASEIGSALKLLGDSRCVNSYLYGAGAGAATVRIEGDDILFNHNHLWRDADNDPIGDLVLYSGYNAGANWGAITIDCNQFDTAVGSNVNITLTANTTVRCINIIANHSIQNDTVSNHPSATCSAAQITLNGTTTLVVSAITSGVVQGATGSAFSGASGTVFVGSVITGANIPANTRIVSQSSGTLGGAGTYIMSAAATASSTSGTYNFTGFPYIQLNIAAGSTLRMLNVVGNTGHGSWNDPTKGLYANFVDATGVLGSLLSFNCSGNMIDNCGAGYGAKGGGFTLLAPTTGSGTNTLMVNSASSTPVTF